MKHKKYSFILFSIFVGALINILFHSSLLNSFQEYGSRSIKPTSIVEYGVNFVLYPFTVYFLVYFIKKLKIKDYRGSIKYIILIVFVWGSIEILGSLYGVRLPAITPNHFRTNIFTGKCDYGGIASYVEEDPWYYRPDCELEQKIRIAKEKGFYQSRLDDCTKYCRSDWDYYCGIVSEGDAYGNGPVNLRCDEIYECNRVNCIKHRESWKNRFDN